jgi:hypothetical protein
MSLDALWLPDAPVRPMSEALRHRRATRAPDRQPRRRPEIFAAWWLTSFGGALATLTLCYFAILYRAGTWIVDRAGVPIYTDFSNQWAAGVLALHGKAPALSDPVAFAGFQATMFPAAQIVYPNWPYPPTFLLLMAPLALLPYRWAFIAWDVLTLCGCVAVVYRIVRRRTAVALALAVPFTAWNFLAAQNGFLTGALIGASLLLLESRPLLAGVFIGVLAYKPQFGILLPLALAAAKEWRAIAGAAATVLLLAALSALLFGGAAWVAFPHGLVAQTAMNLLAGPEGNWGYLQSVYGLARRLHTGIAPAWLVQGMATASLAVIVWRVWRSATAYPLKAASLSAAALLASPQIFAYDLVALVIPAAFLAADQLERGLLPGDKAVWIGLFGAPLALLVTLGDNAGGITFGGTPIGLAVAVGLFAAILRRAIAMQAPGVPSLFRSRRRSAGIAAAPR